MSPNTLHILVALFIEVYVFIAVARFICEAHDVPYSNTLCCLLDKLTFPVRWIDPIIPVALSKKYPISAGIWALLSGTIMHLVAYQVLLNAMPVITQILLQVAFQTISALLMIYKFSLIIHIILSWVAPNSQHYLLQAITCIVQPLYILVHKILPPFGGIDFSPIVILIGIDLLNRALWNLLPGLG